MSLYVKCFMEVTLVVTLCLRKLWRNSTADLWQSLYVTLRQTLHGSHAGSDAMSTKIVKKFDSWFMAVTLRHSMSNASWKSHYVYENCKEIRQLIYGSHCLKLVCPRKSIKQLWRPLTHATGEKLGGGVREREGGGGVSIRSMRAMKRQIDTGRETDTDGDTEITIFELVTILEGECFRCLFSMLMESACSSQSTPL